MKTDHAIEVGCAAEKAFEFCLDVASWPHVFPPCLDAQVLAESETEQQIFLTAKANEQVFSWQSTRQLDRKNRRIEFSQAKPSPLVKYMKGAWTFEPKGAGSIITLTHDFEVNDHVTGVVAGVDSRDDAVAFMLKTVENNSTRELNAIRAELERKSWRHEFSESLLVDHSPTAIYQLLRDAANWPWLLPHCNAVEMIYDDPQYQEFKMNVQVGEIEESIRSIRILHPDRIEYFQPAPPPALKEHQGRWTLRPTEGGVEITSWHAVVLNPDFWAGTEMEEAKRKVETAINRNSLGTMQAILNKLGASDHARA
jgi:aromatase